MSYYQRRQNTLIAMSLAYQAAEETDPREIARLERNIRYLERGHYARKPAVDRSHDEAWLDAVTRDIARKENAE